MSGAGPHSERRRRMVIGLFFAGLLGLAGLAGVLDAVWRRLAGWGAFDLGWLNPIAGAGLAAAGLGGVIWSVYVQYTLGQGTPAPMVATRRLVIRGPYAWTRNPMTLGALVLYLGLGVGLGSALVLLLTAAVFAGLLTYLYVHETRELAERFGAEYRAYQRRTPFLLPRCRPSRDLK